MTAQKHIDCVSQRIRLGGNSDLDERVQEVQEVCSYGFDDNLAWSAQRARAVSVGVRGRCHRTDQSRSRRVIRRPLPSTASGSASVDERTAASRTICPAMRAAHGP